MALEELLAPFRWADNKILQAHTEYVSSSRKSKYDLGQMMMYIATGTQVASCMLHGSVAEYGTATMEVIVGGLSWLSASVTPAFQKWEEAEEDALHPSAEIARRRYKFIRFPCAILAGISTSTLFFGAQIDGTYAAWVDNMTDILDGAFFATMGSAYYFLSVDKNTPKKKSLLERFKEWYADVPAKAETATTRAAL